MSDLSLWWSLNGPGPERAALPGDLDCDVAIVGGGFTGIWTAYYLAELAPELDVAVIEAQRVGFGASGRNGGWCSALFPAEPATVAAAYGRSAAIATQDAMHATVDEVGRVVAAHGIDCGWRKGGTVHFARNEPQLARAHAEIADWREFGYGEDDYRFLTAAEATDRARVDGVVGGTFTPHCAAIDPLRLLRGVAAAAERAGVRIFEQTRAETLAPGQVRTDRGEVRAPYVIRATEAFTAELPGHRRDVAPIYSLMIATEPLPEELWAEIGLAQAETFNDLRHLIIYGQRTPDGRLAFGGRGAPYHFGSRIRAGYDSNHAAHSLLHETLVGIFPHLAATPISHRWGGPLGIARDWWAGVGLDPQTGLGYAGGYVGDGLGTSNLAGRTLAALLTGANSELVRLPWVNRTARRWEPEPLRWLGANAALAAMTAADAQERRSGRSSPIADGVNRLLRG